jgi:serine/threonine protein kinase
MRFMTYTIFLIASMMILVSVRPLCFLSRQKPNEMIVIREVLEKKFKSKDPSAFMREALLNQSTFDSEVREVCRDMPSENISKVERHNGHALGFGGYGTVFTAFFEKDNRESKTEQAVKMISFRRYIIDKVKKGHANLPITDIEKCLNSIFVPKKYEKLFAEKTKNEIEKRKVVSVAPVYSQMAKLEPTDYQPFETKFCKKNQKLQENILKYVNRYFESIRREILLSQQIMDGLNNDRYDDSSPLQKYEYCVIDEAMNVYLVIEPLGQTLESVVNHCPHQIYKSKPELSMKLSLSLAYQVDLLHSMSITHCDIKPENILFGSESYSSVKLNDFGKSSSGMCNGGTMSYMAPEGFIGEKTELKAVDKISNRLEVQKSDTFSTGITILKIELEREDFLEIEEEYSRIQNLEYIEDILEAEENFLALIAGCFESSIKVRFPDRSSHEVKRKVNVRKALKLLLLEMLRFKSSERVPMRFVLYYLNELYQFETSTKKKSLTVVKSYLKNLEKLKEKLNKPGWYNQVREVLGFSASPAAPMINV